MRCLARRATVACPIRKAAALPLSVMRSVRLVLGKTTCHSSAIHSLLRKEDARGSRHRILSSCFLAGVLGVLYVPISCSGSTARP